VNLIAGSSPPGSRVRLLTREDAVRSAVLEALSDATHIHAACHASFRPLAPLDSALELARSEMLTLRDFLTAEARSGKARLAVLSGCGTGLAEFSEWPDEYLGLPAGLLASGVQSVIATLWVVDDFTSCLVMQKFYELYFGADYTSSGLPFREAEALAGAQRWLRETTIGELDDLFRTLYDRLGQGSLPEVCRAFILKGLDHYAHEHDRTRRPFAEAPQHWAAFVFVGA